MPSTPLTRSSIGVATDAATSLALAPGKLACTTTVGGEICGYMASGRVKSAIPPASVMTIESTEAKIGRSMKNFENTGRVSGSGGRLGAAGRSYPLLEALAGRGF